MSRICKIRGKWRLRYYVYYPTGQIMERDRWYTSMKMARIKASLVNTLETLSAKLNYTQREITQWHHAGIISKTDKHHLESHLPDSGKTLSQCLDEWEATWRVGTQEAQTRWSRRRAILRLMDDTTIKSITLEHGYQFITDLRNTSHKNVTIRKYIQDLKRAFNHQVALRYLKYNPFTTLSAGRTPPEEKITPTILTNDQIKKVLAMAQEKDQRPRPWLGGTLAFHLLFFFGTGLRRREAQKSRLEFIDWHERSLTLPAMITKTGKERTVGLGVKLYDALLPRKNQTGYILPRYAPIAVSKAIRKHFRDCGIDARLHDARHTYTSMLQDAGVKPHDAMLRTGHTDLKMLSHYSHGGFKEVYEDRFGFLNHEKS